jgi:hypothetical protein
MFKRLGIVISSAILCSSLWAASGDLLRKPPYVYCNVVFQSGCFGFRSGDTLTTTIPIDFVLYRVAFAFGREALIYVGRHPDVNRESEPPFRPCEGDHGFVACKSRSLATGAYELLGESRSGSVVHVLISPGAGHDEELASFLANVRGCAAEGESITCPPSRSK